MNSNLGFREKRVISAFALVHKVEFCYNESNNNVTVQHLLNYNNHSPRLTVEAMVVSKRVDVSHHQHGNAGDATGAHGYHTTTSTSYYVTFEVESGDRMEFHVNGREYGMLVERDFGRLSFQGTRYLGFERG